MFVNPIEFNFAIKIHVNLSREKHSGAGIIRCWRIIQRANPLLIHFLV